MDALAEIRKIYFSTTKSTIENDFDRCIDLIKTLPNDEAREKAAVFMEGIAQMRIEWKQAAKGGVSPADSRRPSSSRRRGAPPTRSDRSPASSRRKA